MRAVEDAGEVVVLLFLVAEGHDDGRHHLDAEADLIGRVELRALVVEDVALHGRPTGAAELAWARPGRPSRAYAECFASASGRRA